MGDEPSAPHLLAAVEYARILRAAGDPGGAARLLDLAFEAETQHAQPVRDRLRFRALVLRAELAMHLDDTAAAARFRSGADAVRPARE